MEAIRRVTTIKNGAIKFSELTSFDDQEVEVIILLLPPKNPNNAGNEKNAFFRFAGAIETQYSDTSQKVDELIYGK